MDSRERDAFKEQLGAMAAGRGDGIDLDTADRWVIDGLEDPVGFFRHLDKLIPIRGNFYFEGCEVAPGWSEFFTQHRPSEAVAVIRDTIFPVPEMFHVTMSAEVVNGLAEKLVGQKVNTAFDHVKAYRDGRLIFAFHDAFDGSSFLVSDLVGEENVKAFCTALGVRYRREPNVNNRDPELLRRLALHLENPALLRQFWPWWKKLLFFWKR